MYTKIVHLSFDELVFRQIRSLIQITAQIFADSIGKVMRKGQRKKSVRLSVSVEVHILLRLKYLWVYSLRSKFPFCTTVLLDCFL